VGREQPRHLAEAARLLGTEVAGVQADRIGAATQLAEQFAESAKLEGEIRKNLAGLGYGL